MIIITLYSMVYIYYIFTDLIPLYRDKKIKLFWFNTSLFLISYIISILIVLNVALPTPAVPIKNIVTAILGQQK
jgi:hypothetical protein